jgi:hypothetical protein
LGQEDGAAFYGVGNACVEFFDGSVGPAYVYQTVWNCQKAVVALRTKSDVKGVCWNKQSSKWQALISVNRKTYHLGLYTTIEQAQIARKQAEARLSDGTFFDWHKEKSDKPKYDDLTGRKFNRLTVMHRGAGWGPGTNLLLVTGATISVCLTESPAKFIISNK